MCLLRIKFARTCTLYTSGKSWKTYGETAGWFCVRVLKMSTLLARPRSTRLRLMPIEDDRPIRMLGYVVASGCKCCRPSDFDPPREDDQKWLNSRKITTISRGLVESKPADRRVASFLVASLDAPRNEELPRDVRVYLCIYICISYMWVYTRAGFRGGQQGLKPRGLHNANFWVKFPIEWYTTLTRSMYIAWPCYFAINYLNNVKISIWFWFKNG